MSPYVALGAVAVWAGSLWAAYSHGREAEEGAQAREALAAERASAVAAEAAASAIAAIQVQHETIIQPVQREVRERTVYRECRHSPDGLRGVNAALTGATGDGQLPAADPASR
jgi:hypothetical protein